MIQLILFRMRTITPSSVATLCSSSPLSTSLIIPYLDESSNTFTPNVPASHLVINQQGFTNNVFTPVRETTDIDNVFANNNSVFEQDNNIRDSDWVAPAINTDELNNMNRRVTRLMRNNYVDTEEFQSLP